MEDKMTGLGKAVLFDCDGVLVDSEPALARIAAIALADFGAPAKPEDFKPYIGTGEDSYLGEVLKKYNVEYTQEVKQHVYEKYIELADDFVESFAGVRELLEELKSSGYRMAVASSADMIKVEANLKVLSVSDNMFDAVITGSDIERKKPYPDIYLLAADRCNIEPAMCYVVEDAVSGIQSAKAAGMTAIGFTSAHSADELREAGADYIIDSITELMAVLK